MAEPKRTFSRRPLNAAMKTAMTRFADRTDLTGFDIGYRWTEGQPTKELCVRVHVAKKVPASDLTEAEILPAEIDGVALDVIESDYATTLAQAPHNQRGQAAFLMGGTPCGRPDEGSGTIGAIVIDNATGQPAILSCWHVLVGGHGNPGDRIVQPGQSNGRSGTCDVVAEASRSVFDIDGDAAIATLTGDRPWLPVCHGTFDMPSGIRASRIGEVLEKLDGRTDRTHARIDGEGIYRLHYEGRKGETEVRDVAGFRLVPDSPADSADTVLSGRGDSGTIWLNPRTNDAVGLHIAGPKNRDAASNVAIACHMTRVADRLDIRLATYDHLLAQSERAIRSPVGMPATGWLGPHPTPTADPYPTGTGQPYQPARRSPATDQPQDQVHINGDRPAASQPSPGGWPAAIVIEETSESCISVRDYIWPLLKEALVDRSLRFSTACRNDVLSSFLPQPAAAAVVTSAVLASAEFQRDGVAERSPNFRHDVTLNQVCDSLGDIYRSLGFMVVP